MDKPIGRPLGSVNLYPSKAAQREFLRWLRERADEGQLDAMGWLLIVSHIKEGIDNAKG